MSAYPITELVLAHTSGPTASLQSDPHAVGLYLRAGEHWQVTHAPGPWRLCRGVMRLEAAAEPAPLCVGLLLPGDLLEVESLLSPAWRPRALAWTDCVLMPAEADAPEALQRCLSEALLQALRRQQALLRLRRGEIAQRLQELLAMLSQAVNLLEGYLPPLKELASVLDTTPESVSRAVTQARSLTGLPLRFQGSRSGLMAPAAAVAGPPPGIGGCAARTPTSAPSR